MATLSHTTKFWSGKNCKHIEMTNKMFLKGGPSDLKRTFNKNTKQSSVYPQSLIISIHKTPVVENYLTTGDIREFLQTRSTPTIFTRAAHSITYCRYTEESFKHCV